jgi:hypothetical protein
MAEADPSGSAVLDVGLQQLACLDCGFESCREHGCLSLLVVCVVRKNPLSEESYRFWSV